MSTVIRTVEERIRPTDIDKVVNSLDKDGLVLLGIDTVYGFFAKALHQSTFDRLDRIKGNRQTPYAMAFENLDRFVDWAGLPDPVQFRMLCTLTPGPVTCLVKSRSLPDGKYRFKDGVVGIRISGDPILQSILRNLEYPLWATSANRSGMPVPVSFPDVLKSLVNEVDMVIDRGPTTFRQPSTVIDLTSFPYRIIRKGAWLGRTEQAIERSREPLRILVVCTGNICRSPLAARLLQKIAGEPEDSGITVDSAGTHATPGTHATKEMIDAAEDWNINLTKHRAKQLTQEAIQQVDLILAITSEHFERVIQIDPGARQRTQLFGLPIDVRSIPDPYSGGDEDYRIVSEMILRAAGGWIQRFKSLLPEGFSTLTD